jgi:glycogen(starch) synthase
MKILFLSGEYPLRGDVGGIGFYVVAATEALAARGHEVTVLSCARSAVVRDEVLNGVTVHLRPFVRIPGLDRVVKSHSLNNRIRAAISCWVHAARLGLQPDAIEASEWMAEGLLFAILGAPVVVHLHSPFRIMAAEGRESWTLASRLADRLERWAVRRARSVTAPTHLIVDELRRQRWVRRPVEIIPYPINLDLWKDVASAEATDRLVLSVGRVERRKGPDVLVRAGGRLMAAGTDVHVVFLGRSSGELNGVPYLEIVKDAASRLGVSCEFVSEVALSDLGRWFERARVVAVPSTFETCSLVALQAAASGRPVVVSDRVGAGELLVVPGGAAVFPSEDSDALADALQPFLQSTELATAAGATCRRLVTEACAPETVARQREAVYDRVARRRSNPAAALTRAVTSLGGRKSQSRTNGPRATI